MARTSIVHAAWVGLLGIALSLAASPARAHPLGNFSISHYSGLRVDARSLELQYVLDLAEIPTFQEMQATGIAADPQHPSVTGWATRTAEALKDGLRAELDEQRLAFRTLATEVIFPPGAGGLPTLKIGVRYRAELPEAASTATLSYRDTNHADRAGWKEVVAVRGEDVTFVESSVPDTDRSRQLSDYPTDLLQSPPQDTEARVTFTRERPSLAGPAWSTPPSRPQPAPMRLEPNRQATPGSRFTSLMTAGPMGAGVVLMALLIAAGLGAFHALEPGHGKAMVGAYLVGSRGTAWHAVVLGVIVTASHTAGVYLLGGVTLYASRYVVPERLFPWLGVISGLSIAALGGYLFLRRFAGSSDHQHHHHHYDAGHVHAHDHARAHLHDHAHAHTHDHVHAHDHHHIHTPAHGHAHSHGDVSVRALFTLGITAGIVPCPAALVVLLSALSLGRVGFGLLLIVAFSVGLAAVLIVIGLLMVYARRLMDRLRGEGTLTTRWLPLATSAVVTALGLLIAVQALQTAGILQIRFS